MAWSNAPTGRQATGERLSSSFSICLRPHPTAIDRRIAERATGHGRFWLPCPVLYHSTFQAQKSCETRQAQCCSHFYSFLTILHPNRGTLSSYLKQIWVDRGPGG